MKTLLSILFLAIPQISSSQVPPAGHDSTDIIFKGKDFSIISPKFTKISNQANFEGCKLNHLIIPNYVSKIHIHNCSLKDLYIENIHSHTLDIFLTDSIPQTLTLSTNDSCKKIKIEYSGVEHREKIYLALSPDVAKIIDLNYNLFQLGYYNEIDTLKFDESLVFENLLNNFKTKGQQQFYKSADIEYSRYKLINTFFGSFTWWIPELWSNYGYNKERIFLYTIAFVIIFTGYNYDKFERLNREVYNIPNIPVKLPYNISFRKKMWYSFYYTSALFFKLSIKLENLKTEKPWPLIYVLFIYTLGVVCLAYMAGFVIQK